MKRTTDRKHPRTTSIRTLSPAALAAASGGTENTPKPKEKPLEYLTIVLTDVIVSSY